MTQAASVSAALIPLVVGPPREGVAAGHRYVLLGRYAIALVPPGGALMPNGIEGDARIERGERVVVGDGRIGPIELAPTTRIWDPVPRPRVTLRTEPVALDVERIAGRGAGLTPAGDDVLAGYAAGLVLFHRRGDVGGRIAAAAAARTTALSATLLGHAARGELPSPAHALLERGDPAPLLAWGRSSGRHLAFGLALAFDDPLAHRLVLTRKEVHRDHVAA